jgi:hypothetical protein
MSKNLSRRYEKAGFVALVSPDGKSVVQVFPVTANQIYNVIGMKVEFAETKESLATACTQAGYTFKSEQFA